jgi:hypothetical protein
MQVGKFIPLAFFIFGCGLMPLSVSDQAATQNGPLPSDTPPASTPMKLSTGPFTLTIFSPADQAVVNQPQVDIHGEVSADAVVTINEDTYVFNAGPFKQTIQLEEGLNSIQIVASDMDGNEVDLILTITYQP